MKAIVLCQGGLASAVLALLLGKQDRGRAQDSLPTRPSALREQRGLAPEGYALHLLTIRDGQPFSAQRRHAARLIAALLDASYEVLDPAALTWLPTPVSASPMARLFTLAGIVAVRQEAAVIAAGLHTSEPAFVARFNQAALRVGQVTELPRLRLLTPWRGAASQTLSSWAITSASPWRPSGRVLPAARPSAVAARPVSPGRRPFVRQGCWIGPATVSRRCRSVPAKPKERRRTSIPVHRAWSWWLTAVNSCSS